MPLLGPKEKGELERLVLDSLTAYWIAHGSGALLAPGTRVALDTNGPSIVTDGTEGFLASVEIRTLFTALCHLTADGPGSMPRDSLAALAAEAAKSLAAQVNRLVPD